MSLVGFESNFGETSVEARRLKVYMADEKHITTYSLFPLHSFDTFTLSSHAKQVAVA